MFELKDKTTVFLDHAKGRTEHHGEALVTAIDIKVTWQTNNSALAMFQDDMVDSMFCALPRGVQAPKDQAALDLPVSEKPFIRFPHVEYPTKWSREYDGYTLRLDFGLGGESDAVIKLCKLKNFRFTPIEGGSCEIEFGISSAADISGAMVGRFIDLLQRDITVTLLAPARLESDLIDSSAGSGAPGTGPAAEAGDEKPPKASKAKQDATNAFIDAHAGTPPVH